MSCVIHIDHDDDDDAKITYVRLCAKQYVYRPISNEQALCVNANYHSNRQATVVIIPGVISASDDTPGRRMTPQR